MKKTRNERRRETALAKSGIGKGPLTKHMREVLKASAQRLHRDVTRPLTKQERTSLIRRGMITFNPSLGARGSYVITEAAELLT